MSKNTKIVIGIVVGVMFLGCLACGGMMAFGFWTAKEAADPALIEEARALGQQSTETECEKAALDLAFKCSDLDFACNTKVQVFNATCLREASPSEGFCERLGIDDNDDLFQRSVEGGMWAGLECNKIMGGKQACTNVLNATVQHCATQTPRQ